MPFRGYFLAFVLSTVYFKQDITAYQPLSPSENVKNSAIYRGCEVTAFIPILDVLEHLNMYQNYRLSFFGDMNDVL